MRYRIDTDKKVLIIEDGSPEQTLSLYSPEAFHILSTLWLKIGWNARYHYTFTWMGQPILQLPEDIVRLQEVIVHEKPDLIIECGVAFGGSLLFFASILHSIGKGRVVGIDIDIHPPNREKIENHFLGPYINLIEGNSIENSTLEEVRTHIKEGEKILVILDSNHSKEHVLNELYAYHPFVSKDSYLVVQDGFKQELVDVPRGKSHWEWDHPVAAVREFLATHPEFILESPERRYNRSAIRETVTHFTQGWLRRK